MKQERINCIFHTSSWKCAHLERGRTFFGFRKMCILHEEFPSDCNRKIINNIDMPSVKPPRKR